MLRRTPRSHALPRCCRGSRMPQFLEVASRPARPFAATRLALLSAFYSLIYSASMYFVHLHKERT